jgi:hypothetical protein
MMLRDFTASESNASNTQAEKSSGCATVRGWRWNRAGVTGNRNGSVSDIPVLLNAVHDVAEIVYSRMICRITSDPASAIENHNEGRRVRVQERNERRGVAGIKIVGRADCGVERKENGCVKRLSLVVCLETELRKGISEAADFSVITPHLHRLPRHNRRHQRRRQNKSLFHGLNEVGCIRRTNREKPMNLRGCRV